MLKKDYNNMTIKNDSHIMYLYGWYYESINDYENMKKYYNMAIEKGNKLAKEELDKYNEMSKQKSEKQNN